MLDVYENIRLLAKSNKYQNLYSQAKELNIQLFENNHSFSHIQIEFLHYLTFYSNMMTDYSMGEVDYIVFDNTTYEDAYHYYKVNSNRKKLKEQRTDRPKNPTSNKETLSMGDSSWVFKSRKMDKT